MREHPHLDPITLPQQADGDLDAVRPVFRNKGKHMIGKGTGAYFTLRMATHISRTLGITPVIYDATRYNLPANSITSGPIPTRKLPVALASSGWQSLRIAVLYDKDTTPRRILAVLRDDYGICLPTDLDAPDAVLNGATVEIAPGITAVMCKAPEITMHGDHDRSATIRQLPSLNHTGPDDLVAALCETAWSGQRIAKDGKHPTRRNLAAARIVSQFLVAKDQPEEGESDYATSSALRDLFRACGIVDDRLGRAAGAHPGVRMHAPLTEPVTLVGIHLRRHIYKKVKGRPVKPPKLVAVLTAVHLDTTPESTPRVELFANGRWLRHAEGLAAFHAGDIGNELWGRDADGAQAVRSHIEGALDALIVPPTTNRVVIVVDKEGAQSIYAGIDDNPTITAPLPGRRLLQDGIDVAVVRIALGPHSPRPATAYRRGEDLDLKRKPSYHKRILFAHNNGDEASWLLTQDSHQHQGAKSPLRIGTDYAREDFATIAPSRMGKDMHATSRAEITIPSPGSWNRGDLAILIARLSEQAIAWDSRTSRAAPLHLGNAADRDHPDYSNHDSSSEADEDEPDDLDED